jgi:hypothetical protein
MSNLNLSDKQAACLRFRAIEAKASNLEEKLYKLEDKIINLYKLEELEKSIRVLEKQNLLLSNYIIKKDILNKNEEKIQSERELIECIKNGLEEQIYNKHIPNKIKNTEKKLKIDIFSDSHNYPFDDTDSSD